MSSVGLEEEEECTLGGVAVVVGAAKNRSMWSGSVTPIGIDASPLYQKTVDSVDKVEVVVERT